MSQNLKERVQYLEEKYKLISDKLVEAVFVIDADTRKFDYISPSITAISGFTSEEYENMSLESRLSGDSYKEVQAAFEEEIKGFGQGEKAIRTLEVELIHKDGSMYWAEIRAKLLRKKNHPLKILGVIHEITKRKTAENAQKDLIQKLEALVAEKDRLLQENKVLRELLPICSGCKRIRDEDNRWWPLDAYVKSRMNTNLTHTICPDCKEVFYGDL